MGYVKKKNMSINNKGKPYTTIGTYTIIKESDHMTGIYKREVLITSKPKWSQAIKLAELLSNAYQEGYTDARDIYDEDVHRW